MINNNIMNFNNFNLVELLQFEIYINLSKGSNKNYILFDVLNKSFIHNLGIFDIFLFFKEHQMINLLKLLDIKQDVYNNKDFSFIQNFFLSNSKDLFLRFKDIVTLNSIVVVDTMYKPINKRVIIKEGKKYLNMFNIKNDISQIKPNINAKYPHIRFIIKNIAGSDVAYDYFLNFLAYKLQYPTDVITCHFIIQDDGGTGKSSLLLGDILNRMFTVNVITQTDLMSEFNSFMAGSSLIWCEEVEGFEDEKRLKALTGAKYIFLNEKHEKLKKIKNYNNFIIVSNELRVLKITEKDRRFSVIGGGKRLSPLNNNEWDKTAFKTRDNNEFFFQDYEQTINDEVKEFISYLLSIKVSRNSVQVPLNNKLKQNLISLNKTSELSFIDDINDNSISEVIKDCYPSNYNNIINSFIFEYKNEFYIKFNDFYTLYIQYCIINQYSKKLSKRAFSMRLNKYDSFIENFENNCSIWVDNDNNKCLKLKNFKSINNNNNNMLNDDLIDLS